MFKKAACFTDIHFGLKGNSRVHNDDAEAFVNWFIAQAKKNGCETCIFLGDWHHHRSAVNVSTMNYTISNMERLNNAFKDVYVLMGNHDLFYREKREINSMEFVRYLPNVHIVNDWMLMDDVALIPWLEPEEHLKISELNEAHRVAAIAWDKYARNIRIELAKAPKERPEAHMFLKYCRDEFDRLMETSPSVPEQIIKLFKKTFLHSKDAKVLEKMEKLEK